MHTIPVHCYVANVYLVFIFMCTHSLIVDVKLGATRTAKIQIWRGDDPFDSASSFARIYSLDLKARDLLVAVIRQSMTENGLLLPLEDPSLSFSDALQEAGAGALRVSASGDLDDGFLGQDAHFVGDEYDSQSSVSESGDESHSDVSSGDEEEEEDEASEGSGSKSELLTA